MPNIDFGEQANYEKGGRFVQLKAKNDKVLFRIVKSPFYDGKHFRKENDKWIVTDCPKIMEGLHCDTCETYFEMIRPIKELRASITEKNKVKIEGEIKVIKDKANPYKVRVTFYYPIIDRSDGSGKLLKTTVGVRNKIDEEVKLRDVTKFDYTLIRTEGVGSDYYKLDRVDSAETKPLTEKEEQEIKEINDWDVEQMVKGKQSKQLLREEPKNHSEDIDPNDIPI